MGDGTNTDRNTPVQASGISDAIAIAAGVHSLAVKSDCTVWAWGLNDWGQLGDGTNTDSNIPVQVSGLVLCVSVTPTPTPSPTPTPVETPSPTPPETPTPSPSPIVTPTPTPTPSGCDGKAKTVETDTGDFELLKLENKVVTVTVTDAGGCPVANKKVSAKVNRAGKKRISISMSSETTDENGAAAFTITAKKKTGKAKVTFKAGGIKKKMTVKVM